MRYPVSRPVYFGISAVLFLILIVFLLPSLLTSSYSGTSPGAVLEADTEPAFKVTHVDTPAGVKALYMTACVAGTPSWRTNLKSLIEDTELNAVVLDIKDATGRISFPTNLPQADSGKGCVVPGMREFIAELHESGIYVIGRISVFQDPSYTALFPELAVRKVSDGGVWKDFKGLSFVDVGAKDYWDYVVELAQLSYGIGFDELNFDYVRYPSDGPMADALYTWSNASTTRAENLENFFSYLSTRVRESTGAKLSVDLFGMTTTNTDDLGIGQVLERALPYFDYIDPMVYPSHYPKTWNGFANPAEHPYDVIKISMSSAIDREAVWRTGRGLATTTPSKMRPWLQDFNLGATYGTAEVRAQVQATYDLGLTSWLLWNAGNKYTESALLREPS